MNLSLKIKGLEKVQKDVDKYIKNILEDIDAELSASAVNIATNAKKDVNVDMGGLRSSINFKVETFLYKEINANSYYAPYVEFGTKTRISIPQRLEAIASEARGKGKGKGKLKDAIYGWAKRKGIDKKIWGAIYLSILRKGSYPHPFFFKNFYSETPRLIEKLKKIVNR